MYPPIQPLLVRTGSASKGKGRRMSKASSRRVAAEYDNKDPLSCAQVK